MQEAAAGGTPLPGTIPGNLSGAAGPVKITAIKAMQVRTQGTLIRVETDAGIVGYGECHATGPLARAVIAGIGAGRLPHLGLLGKDPLAINVHFHNMFYAYPQRPPYVRVMSGIDIALWDLAGKLLNQPVSKLLGGNFRETIPLYSHCPGGDFLDRGAWQERAAELLSDPGGFRAFKVDIHPALGTPMQQYMPSFGPHEIRRVERAYALAREALGPEIEIIVHCHCELDVPSAIRVAEAVEPIAPLFYEDPLAPQFSEGWLALRRATRLTLMTGENLESPEDALPFVQQQAVNVLQPDLINSGGITGVTRIANLAALYRMPVCLHNVSGLPLQMASQQWSAARFNCPMMECRRGEIAGQAAASNAPVIRNGEMAVSTQPGLGIDWNEDYLRANLAEGEPWWA